MDFITLNALGYHPTSVSFCQSIYEFFLTFLTSQCWSAPGLSPWFFCSLSYSHLWWFNPISCLKKIYILNILQFISSTHISPLNFTHISCTTSPLGCLIGISNLTCPQTHFLFIPPLPKIIFSISFFPYFINRSYIPPVFQSSLTFFPFLSLTTDIQFFMGHHLWVLQNISRLW